MIFGGGDKAWREKALICIAVKYLHLVFCVNPSQFHIKHSSVRKQAPMSKWRQSAGRRKKCFSIEVDRDICSFPRRDGGRIWGLIMTMMMLMMSKIVTRWRTTSKLQYTRLPELWLCLCLSEWIDPNSQERYTTDNYFFFYKYSKLSHSIHLYFIVPIF